VPSLQMWCRNTFLDRYNEMVLPERKRGEAMKELRNDCLGLCCEKNDRLLIIIQ